MHAPSEEAAAARIEEAEPRINVLPTRFFSVARDEGRRFPREPCDHHGCIAGCRLR